MTAAKLGKVALLWRGDRQARHEATPDNNNRFSAVFAALAAQGVHAEPAVYADDMAAEVRAQLLRLDGVLVWVNPIADGGTGPFSMRCCGRCGAGVWVSAHPATSSSRWA
jgi:hypothetical protein